MQITRTTKTVEVVTKVEEPRFTISDLTQQEVNMLYALVGISNAEIRAKLTSTDWNGNWNDTRLFNQLSEVKNCLPPTRWEIRKV